MQIFSYQARETRGVGVIADSESFIARGEILPGLPHSLRAILEEPHGIERIRDAVAGRKGNRPISPGAWRRRSGAMKSALRCIKPQNRRPLDVDNNYHSY